MYLTKSVTADNGATVAHHRVQRVELSIDMQYLQVFLQSWPNATLRDEGQPPLAHWMCRKAAADCDYSGGMASAIEDAVLSSEWFSGATVTAEG